jgi:prevent-host-death family protein
MLQFVHNVQIDVSDVEKTMQKIISATNLRTTIKKVINEVSYGQNQYVIEKFGEPTAAIINMDDYALLQAIQQPDVAGSFVDVLDNIRSRNQDADLDEIDALVEEARSLFFESQLN